MSVRLHDIALTPDGARRQRRASSRTRPTGRVVRQAYLGSYRDYLVDLADGQQVRVTAPLRASTSRSAARCDCISRRSIAARWRS